VSDHGLALLRWAPCIVERLPKVNSQSVADLLSTDGYAPLREVYTIYCSHHTKFRFSSFSGLKNGFWGLSFWIQNGEFLNLF